MGGKLNISKTQCGVIVYNQLDGMAIGSSIWKYVSGTVWKNNFGNKSTETNEMIPIRR